MNVYPHFVPPPSTPTFVSRAGLKLHHALTTFNVTPTNWTCADFGCNVGGFTHCLLHHGAEKVFAIDTGYGILDYRLRINPRVVVLERTNALHVSPPRPPEGEGRGEGPAIISIQPHQHLQLVDLVTIDLAWTRQHHSIPAAIRWLRSAPKARSASEGSPLPSQESVSQRSVVPGEGGEGLHRLAPPLIISLIKPHYELLESEKHLLRNGFLPHGHAHDVFLRLIADFPSLGVTPLAHTQSPLTGGKSSRKKKSPGNIEFLVLLRPR